MSRVAEASLQPVIQPMLGIVEALCDIDPKKDEARAPDRDQQRLVGHSMGRQIPKPDLDQVTAGQGGEIRGHTNRVRVNSTTFHA